MTQEEFVVEVPGGRIAGDQMGDGPAVVLLHAGIADRRMWTLIRPELAERYRAIRFDARGYGSSPPSSAPYRPASDVLAVLDALRVERAHLVGASMGGAVALDVAVAWPQRVASLALLSSALPGHDFGPQVQEYWQAEEDLLTQGDIDGVIQLNLEMWLRGRGREWTPRLRAIADGLRDQLRIIATHQVGGEDWEESAEAPARDALGSIGPTTLVVVGENDPEDFVRIAEFIAAQVSTARLVVMPDTAHLPALERPEETLAALQPHLADALG